MAIDPRYATLVAILDDPLNRACIERELARRQKVRSSTKGLLPPPTPREGGAGAVYLSMEEYLNNPKTIIKNGDEANLHYLLDVFEGTEGWLIIREDLSEVGPFPTLPEAQKEAETLLQSEGYELLTEFPWAQTEVEAYPL
jgi:hypothetical protein